MAKYTFSMESDDLAEIIDFLGRSSPDGYLKPEETEPAPLAERKPKGRPRKAEEPAAEISANTAGETTSTTTTEVAADTPLPASPVESSSEPVDHGVTLADINDAAGDALKRNPQKAGQIIRAALVDRYGTAQLLTLDPAVLPEVLEIIKGVS